MIRFNLRCDKGHDFESWFGSGADYDRLHDRGLVSCAVCGSVAVSKAPMAPSVRINDRQGAPKMAPDRAPAPAAALAAAPAPAATQPDTGPLRQPAHPAEAALAALRAHFESNVENVGRDFALEARRIHHGETPDRPIWGEARPDEARSLIEDGISIAPLPWISARKAN